MQIPSAVAALLVFWYAIHARNAMERDKREAELNERQAGLDERQAQQDAREAKLKTLKASNKQYVIKKRAEFAAQNQKYDDRKTEFDDYKKKINEKIARNREWDEKLYEKYQQMQEVVKTHDELLASFKCGISLDIFEDPVMIASGQTYSMKSIREWFRYNDTCPNTREHIWNKRLFPNIAMKASVSALKKSFLAMKEFKKLMKPPKTPATDEPSKSEAAAAEAAAAEAAVDSV
jgi:hypothetical protein